MEIRELLQKEIWSKRTSRKILIGLGIVSVGLIVGSALNERWITPPERNAGRVALAQIEVLQSSNEMSDAEFDAKDLQAKQKVDLAEQAAWTSQDTRISAQLLGYLSLLETKRFDQKRKLRTAFQQEWDRKFLQFIKDVLHRELD